MGSFRGHAVPLQAKLRGQRHAAGILNWFRFSDNTQINNKMCVCVSLSLLRKQSSSSIIGLSWKMPRCSAFVEYSPERMLKWFVTQPLITESAYDLSMLVSHDGFHTPGHRIQTEQNWRYQIPSKPGIAETQSSCSQRTFQGQPGLALFQLRSTTSGAFDIVCPPVSNHSPSRI